MDRGRGICFAVYCYNVQPGVEIDYHTGESWREGERPVPTKPESTVTETNTVEAPETESESSLTYVVNTRSKRFHLPDCDAVEKIKDKNRAEFSGTREDLIEEGYQPCGSCKP